MGQGQLRLDLCFASWESNLEKSPFPPPHSYNRQPVCERIKQELPICHDLGVPNEAPLPEETCHVV